VVRVIPLLVLALLTAPFARADEPANPAIDMELPDRNDRIFIYCNNNFTGDEAAFPLKRADASLNLSTFIALDSYGYRNVYELGPRLDVADSRLPFEGSGVPPGK